MFEASAESKIAMSPLFLPLLLAMSAQAVPAPLPACDAIADAATCSEQVRFRDDDYDRMTVPVRVGGNGPFRFLVDTGADRSAVSDALAASLGLTPRSAATLHSAAGVSDVAIVRVPRIELASRSIEGLDAPVLERAHMGADGILGIDSLRSQRIVIDFRNQRMFLTPSPKREPQPAGDEIVIVGRLRKGHLIFTEAHVDGQSVTAVIDTGAQISIGNLALRELMLRRRRLDPPIPVTLTAVTGQALNGNLHVARKIDLDGVEVRNVGIMFADAETFRAIGRADRPTLLLGMNALRSFDEVTIDLDRKKLRLRLPRGRS